MYELITFELYWVSEFRRAWFVENVKYYSSISEIARDYGRSTYRLSEVYRAAYKSLDNVKDPLCFFTHYPKTYYHKTDLSKYRHGIGYRHSNYHPNYPHRKIAVFKHNVRVSMVTVYMAAIEYWKGLPRDIHGRVIDHKPWRHRRHNSAHRGRSPRTKNESTWNDALEHDRMDLEDLGYSWHHLKARTRWLPTTWDDLVTNKGNTWKTHRKKQYRVKN